jgi:transposase
MTLTDEQWAVLEPLVEACRPHAKVPPQHLRWTIGAIIWRHDNGAKWRALPGEEGPWWMAARPSSAGRGWACGSACWQWLKTEAWVQA